MERVAQLYQVSRWSETCRANIVNRAVVESGTNVGIQFKNVRVAAIGGNLFVTYIKSSHNGHNSLQVGISLNGGETWTVNQIAEDVTGPLRLAAVRTPKGARLYVIFFQGDTLVSAISSDTGSSWHTVLISKLEAAGGAVSLQALGRLPRDTLYLCYRDEGTQLLHFRKSTDGGLSWYVPKASQTAWPVAGAGAAVALTALQGQTHCDDVLYILYIRGRRAGGLEMAKSFGGGSEGTWGQTRLGSHNCSEAAMTAKRGSKVGTTDTLFVAYRDSAGGDLRFLRSGPDGGRTWGPSSLVEANILARPISMVRSDNILYIVHWRALGEALVTTASYADGRSGSWAQPCLVGSSTQTGSSSQHGATGACDGDFYICYSERYPVSSILVARLEVNREAGERAKMTPIRTVLSRIRSPRPERLVEQPPHQTHAHVPQYSTRIPHIPWGHTKRVGTGPDKNAVKPQRYPNPPRLQGLPNPSRFQGLPNPSRFQGLPNPSRFQGLPNPPGSTRIQRYTANTWSARPTYAPTTRRVRRPNNTVRRTK